MGVAGEEGALGHIKEGLGQRRGKKWELDFTQVGWRQDTAGRDSGCGGHTSAVAGDCEVAHPDLRRLPVKVQKLPGRSLATQRLNSAGTCD